jgi:proline iminopeptidase
MIKKPSKTYSSSIHPRPLRDLYPEIQPYSQGFLKLDDIHTMYWEQCGNPDGVPILSVHGGPGEGSSSIHRRFFDPNHYRIILFDQRGAGRAQPLGCTERNSLDLLVSDIEMLRKHLRVDKWHLFGGSWGSTLSLAYAINHPKHCISLILRGIFLMQRYEVEWFLGGMKTVFPEAWDAFANGLTDPQQIFEAYYKDLNSLDNQVAIAAALKWNAYESACASFLPVRDIVTTEDQRYYALAMAKMEAHYFKNEVIPDDQSLLTKIDTVRHIPSIIIHGRYDMICPIETAHRLHIAWPEADYVIVPDAGHSCLDPPLRSRLIEATDHAKYMR